MDDAKEYHMEYEVFEDKEVSGQWRVESFGPEGECYVTIFSGPDAEFRARTYTALVSVTSPAEQRGWDSLWAAQAEGREVTYAMHYIRNAIREPLESRLEALEEALRMAYQALGANEEWQDEPRRQIAAILGLATPREGQ